MFDLIANYWWTFLIRGIAAIAFGLIALVWPGMTLTVLIVVFGIYVIFEGVLSIVAAFNNRWVKSWWVLLLEGLAVVWLIGIYALLFGGLLTFLGLKFRKLQTPRAA